MQIRRAMPEDLDEVCSLVSREGLPSLPLGIPVANVLVALEGSAVCGALALEVTAFVGLLLAVVVAEDQRGAGVGTSLIRASFSRANELGLRDIFCLAASARGFFARVGFVDVSLDALPAELRSRPELREQASQGASTMCYHVASRYM